MQLRWEQVVRLKIKMKNWRSSREGKNGGSGKKESGGRNSDSSWSQTGSSSEESTSSNLLVYFLNYHSGFFVHDR